MCGAEARVGNCVNIRAFYAKEVPSQGRENLSLNPLHSSVSAFIPHFNLTALFQALTCQPELQPQVLRLGKARASAVTVPKEGAQNCW